MINIPCRYLRKPVRALAVSVPHFSFHSHGSKHTVVIGDTACSNRYCCYGNVGCGPYETTALVPIYGSDPWGNIIASNANCDNRWRDFLGCLGDYPCGLVCCIDQLRDLSCIRESAPLRFSWRHFVLDFCDRTDRMRGRNYSSSLLYLVF